MPNRSRRPGRNDGISGGGGGGGGIMKWLGAGMGSSAMGNAPISAEEASAQGAEVPSLDGNYAGEMQNSAQYTNPFTKQPTFWDRAFHSPYESAYNQYNLSTAANADQLANAQALALYNTQTLRPMEKQQDIDYETTMLPKRSDAQIMVAHGIPSEYRDTAAPQLYRTFSGNQSLLQQQDANNLARLRGAAGDQYSIGYNSGANELANLQNQGVGLGYAGEDLLANRAAQQQITRQQLINQLGTAQAAGTDLNFAKTLEPQQQALMNQELANRIKQAQNPLASAFPYQSTAYNLGGTNVVNPVYQARGEIEAELKAKEADLAKKKLEALMPSAQRPVSAPIAPRVIGITKDGKPITF